VITVAIFTFGVLLRDHGINEMFLTAVSLAVAAMPGGLVAFMTITLVLVCGACLNVMPLFADFLSSSLDELARTSASESASTLRGQAAVACARLAYQHLVKSSRWQDLSKKGAQIQRLLWASTGTKDPVYSEIKYIEALIGGKTVNTMPPQTLAAYRDHGHPALRIEQELDEARALPGKLSELGIHLDAVSEQLEAEGVQKFIVPFDQLLERMHQRRSGFDYTE
jgi:transaldolase/fructose-6-phosphate aldolase-like protein